MPAEVNNELGKKLGDLALETLNKIHRIVGEDALTRNMDQKVSVDNYMFNESMCIMQFLGFMIDDYKYNMREAVGRMESNQRMRSSIDLGRDFFEPR